MTGKSELEQFDAVAPGASCPMSRFFFWTLAFHDSLTAKDFERPESRSSHESVPDRSFFTPVHPGRPAQHVIPSEAEGQSTSHRSLAAHKTNCRNSCATA